jgi:hypothetical protein
MVEPRVSSWSKLIYTHLHHEPFLPRAAAWGIPARAALSPEPTERCRGWFVRDRGRLLSFFPELRIEEVQPMMPFRYLVSGGVATRTLMPEILYPLWRGLESALSTWMDRLGMFCLFNVRRN